MVKRTDLCFALHPTVPRGVGGCLTPLLIREFPPQLGTVPSYQSRLNTCKQENDATGPHTVSRRCLGVVLVTADGATLDAKAAMLGRSGNEGIGRGTIVVETSSLTWSGLAECRSRSKPQVRSALCL
eukprot:5127576-Amphidinium_carterae.1